MTVGMSTQFRMAAIAAGVATGLSGPAGAVVLGEFWDVTGPVGSIAAAEAAIAAGAPDATFRSTAIDYPNGTFDFTAPEFISSMTTLATFLGVDGPSVVGAADATIEGSVFRFTGFLDLVAGPQTFTVGSDDGYRLRIDGALISEQDAPRGFAPTEVIVDAGQGLTPFELIFYEDFGESSVLFTVDAGLVTGVAVPLPASLVLLLSGLGALAWIRRRAA